MPILDLLSLKPTVISKNLKDKYILLYGPPKVGKTTFAAQCPDNLMLCFEKGVNFISGIYAADIEKWSDFKAILKQLERPDIKNKFKTITIDTLNVAWELCNQFICKKYDVDDISYIPYGKGYDLRDTEFNNALRQITILGYGLILIAHVKIKTKKTQNEEIITNISPNIPDRAQEIVNALVDITGYISMSVVPDENGQLKTVRKIITQSTDIITAGTRCKFLKPEIPFDYNIFSSEIQKAIEEAEKHGAKTTDYKEKTQIIEKRNFSETVQEAKQLWEEKVVVSNDEKMAEKISEKINQLFVKPFLLSEIPESQQDLFELLIDEIKNM